MKNTKSLCLAIVLGILSNGLQGLNSAIANPQRNPVIEAAALRQAIELEVTAQLDQQLLDPEFREAVRSKITRQLRSAGIPTTDTNIANELNRCRAQSIRWLINIQERAVIRAELQELEGRLSQ